MNPIYNNSLSKLINTHISSIQLEFRLVLNLSIYILIFNQIPVEKGKIRILSQSTSKSPLKSDFNSVSMIFNTHLSSFAGVSFFKKLENYLHQL